jgi:sigma-E factor negative regulatory protein RseC
MENSIQHSGIIEKIENGTAYVRITQKSACAGCHAKGICSAADMKVKTIEVPTYGEQWSAGEEVEICGKASMGMKAVFVAFVVPLLAMLSAIVAGNLLEMQDSKSALLALLLLTVYYLMLYLNREKLKNKFIFHLKGKHNRINIS